LAGPRLLTMRLGQPQFLSATRLSLGGSCCLDFMDPSNVFFWNVRGLNGTVRQDVVRGLIVSSRIDVVCLQETKMEEVTRVTVLQMLGPKFSNYIFLPLVGASRGILVAWRDCLGSPGSSRTDGHSVSVQFCPVEGPPWWLTCVYGPQGSEAKIQFLQELREV
jgi:exonuclease III